MFFSDCVAPHFLQLIKFSCFGQHNVNHNVDVIHQHPLAAMLTLSSVRYLFYSLFGVKFYKISDGFDLRGAAGFTDDKEIGYGFRYLSQI